MIYELLMDQFDRAHSVRNLMRAPFGIYDPTVAPGQARLMGALYPLVLTPGSDHTAANPAYQPTNPLHTAPSLARDYTRMKRDLLAFGQVSRLCRAEYRAWQAINLSAFVRVEELDWYMRIFFPIVNPNDPRSSQYHWNAPEIVFPWWKSGIHDVTPIFDHFRRNYRNPPAVIPGQAPRLAAPVVWSPTHVFINGSVQHDYKIREILFKENHLPGPGWFNTLMSYVTTPGTSHGIAKIEMRSHGHPHTRHFARLDIWFEARPGLAWVNGKNWRWPNYTLPDTALNVGMTNSQRRTWEIRQFIRDTGLSDPEIMGFWEVRLGVLGRHAIGGLGVY